MICQTGGTQTQDSETGQVNSTQEIFIKVRSAQPNPLRGRLAEMKSNLKMEDGDAGEVLSCRGVTADWTSCRGWNCRLDKEAQQTDMKEYP